MTRAADRLNVTQSAVSHQLREIEDRLGTPIFIRSGRRMLPTPAGRLLIDAAASVLDAIRDAEAKVWQLATNTGGELRVASHCYTGYHWLPSLIGALRQRYPDSRIRIAPEFTLNPIAALLDAKLDVAIVNETSGDNRLRIRELFEDEYVAVVHPKHSWAARAFVTGEDLAAEPLYLYSRSIENNFVVKRVIRPAGLELQHVTHLQLTEGILEMIKAGLGAGVLPKWTHNQQLRGVDAQHVSARRTERQAQRQLAGTRHGLRRGQVGNVHAGDQQHEGSGREQHQQRGADRPELPLARRHGAVRPAVMRARKLLRHLAAD